MQLLDTLGGLPDRAVNLAFRAERRARNTDADALRAELAFYARPQFREQKGFFTLPAQPPPMSLLEHKPWQDGEQRLYRYASGYQPRQASVAPRFLAHRENRDGYLLHWRHGSDAGAAARPLVLCVHGFRMGQPQRAMAMFKVEKLFRLGMDVALFIQPHHWRRAAPGLRQNFFVGEDLPLTIENIGQQVHDLQACYLALEAMGYDRIGLIGGSLGGLAVALHATVSAAPVFDFAVVPAIRLDKHLDPRNAKLPFRVDEALRQASFRALDIVDPAFYTPRMDTARIGVVYHRGDLINPADATAAWVRQWGIANATALAGGHWLVFDNRARGKAWYGWLRRFGFIND
jgi:hypothetical protein